MLGMVNLSILKWLLVYSFYDKKSVKIPKGATSNRESMKVRQHNDQKNKEKRTNNDLQNTTNKQIK